MAVTGARGAVDVADRAELIDLVSRYAAAVDRRDIEQVVACFTDDAHVEFDGGAEVVDGRPALEAFFEAAFRRPRMGTTGASTHLMSNVLVDVDGDLAHAETQAVAYLASDSRQTVIVRGLRYSDDCVRGDDGWRVRRRVHRALWQAEIPGAPLPGAAT